MSGLIFYNNNNINDLQAALDETAEARVISHDISSAFDLVNHDGLLYKLKSLGVGGPTFNVLITFF